MHEIRCHRCGRKLAELTARNGYRIRCTKCGHLNEKKGA